MRPLSSITANIITRIQKVLIAAIRVALHNRWQSGAREADHV